MNRIMYDVQASDITELLYKLQLREFEEHFKKVRGYMGLRIWVSALTQCPRKWFYILRFPELSQVEFKGFFVLGKAVHMGLQQLLEEYYPSLGYDRVESEVEVEKQVQLDDGKVVLLSGRVDVIAYRGDEKIVYEFKTARSDIGLPHEQHVLQLKIYMNMVNANKGILLYVTPDRVAEYKVDTYISDDELKKLVDWFMKADTPRYDWECSYCPYAVMCPVKRDNYNSAGRRQT